MKAGLKTEMIHLVNFETSSINTGTAAPSASASQSRPTLTLFTHHGKHSRAIQAARYCSTARVIDFRGITSDSTKGRRRT